MKLCHNKTQLLCSRDIAYSITKKCNEKQECSFDVTDDELRSRCGRVADISLDVTYFCGKDTFGHWKLILKFNSLKDEKVLGNSHIAYVLMILYDLSFFVWVRELIIRIYISSRHWAYKQLFLQMIDFLAISQVASLKLASKNVTFLVNYLFIIH